jgi:hypothetical protein
VLDEAPKHLPDDEWYGLPLGRFPYYVEKLLDLVEREGVQLNALARIEWVWMAALERSECGLRALQASLGGDPALFVNLLKLIFRGDNDDASAEPTEQDRLRARQAFRLLNAWRRVPGTVSAPVSPGEKAEGDIVFPPGAIDEKQLVNWVTDAKACRSGGTSRGVRLPARHIEHFPPAYD